MSNYDETVQDVARRVRSEEREACAKICDEMALYLADKVGASGEPEAFVALTNEIAGLIRDRNKMED
jgi:hypothetical protein